MHRAEIDQEHNRLILRWVDSLNTSEVDRLQAEFAAVAAMPDIQALMIRLGLIPVVSLPPAELQKFLASEIDRWGGIIERAGVAKSQ